LCCFSTSVYCCKRIFHYRLSPETFGYTLAGYSTAQCLDFSTKAKVQKLHDPYKGSKEEILGVGEDLSMIWALIPYTSEAVFDNFCVDSFCVGGTGQVYEGRGWDVIGSHAPNYNSRSIGIVFIGNFSSK
jgi:hypothetical protein